MAKGKKHRKGRVQATAAPKIEPVYLLMIAAAVVGGILLLIVSLINRGGADATFKPEVVGAPRVAVEQDQIDHGTVKLNTTIQSVYTIRNVGDRDLVVLGEPQVEVVEGC